MEYSSRYGIEKMAKELEVSMGDIALLYRNYILEMRDEISAMQKSFDGQNWDMVRRIVHNIKGVSANLNINDVYEAAADFNELLKEDNISEAYLHVGRIASVFDNAESEIKDYFLRQGFSL